MARSMYKLKMYISLAKCISFFFFFFCSPLCCHDAVKATLTANPPGALARTRNTNMQKLQIFYAVYFRRPIAIRNSDMHATALIVVENSSRWLNRYCSVGKVGQTCILRPRHWARCFVLGVAPAACCCISAAAPDFQPSSSSRHTARKIGELITPHARTQSKPCQCGCIHPKAFAKKSGSSRAKKNPPKSGTTVSHLAFHCQK